MSRRIFILANLITAMLYPFVFLLLEKTIGYNLLINVICFSMIFINIITLAVVGIPNKQMPLKYLIMYVISVILVNIFLYLTFSNYQIYESNSDRLVIYSYLDNIFGSDNIIMYYGLVQIDMLLINNVINKFVNNQDEPLTNKIKYNTIIIFCGVVTLILCPIALSYYNQHININLTYSIIVELLFLLFAFIVSLYSSVDNKIMKIITNISVLVFSIWINYNYIMMFISSAIDAGLFSVISILWFMGISFILWIISLIVKIIISNIVIKR